MTNIEVAGRICDLLGKPRDLIKLVADRLGHDRRYAVDWAKIRALGWAPETPFDAGLEATVRWYEGQRQWWEASRTAAANSRPSTSNITKTAAERPVNLQRLPGPRREGL